MYNVILTWGIHILMKGLNFLGNEITVMNNVAIIFLKKTHTLPSVQNVFFQDCKSILNSVHLHISILHVLYFLLS